MRTILLSLLVVGFVGCAGNRPPNLTPEQLALYRADDALVAIGTVQHAAIELNKIKTCTSATPPVCTPTIMSDRNTGIIVDAVADAVPVIVATPEGWRAAVSALLERVQSRLDAAGLTRVRPYLDVLRLLVNGGA